MKLYEHEAKRLLADAGVSVPEGKLYPSLVSVPTPHHSLVAKTQLLQGGRGKRGGVIVVTSNDELEHAIETLRRGSATLPPAENVLVERYVAGQSEYYVAFMIDRDECSAALLLSPRGGVDVDRLGREDLTRLPISVSAPQLPQSTLERAASALGIADRESLDRVLGGMWKVFVDHECLLLEVNPLTLREDGRLMAVDAKVDLDASGHGVTAGTYTSRDGTLFESQCSDLGVTATELGGDIAIIASGAGLGMATLDQITQLGGSARCVVDLGYSTLESVETLIEMTRLVCGLEPSIVFANAFFQIARGDKFAEALCAALEPLAGGPPVVVRLCGNGSLEGSAILAECTRLVTSQMSEACAAAVHLSSRASKG